MQNSRSSATTAAAPAPGVNINFLLDQLNRGGQASEEAIGQSIALFVGLTGSGKSTLINYLLNVPLEPYDDDQRVTISEARLGIEENDPEKDKIKLNMQLPGSSQCISFWAPKIGHRTISQTQFPGIYHWPYGHNTGLPTCLVDTAGFADTRGEEYEFGAGLGLFLPVEAAAEMKAIVVVISVKELEARSDRLQKMCAALNGLLDEQSRDYHEASVLFVFQEPDAKTKMPARRMTRQTLQGKLRKILGDFNDYIQSEQVHGKSLSVEVSKTRIFLDFMVNHPQNVLLYDPLDAGESRTAILSFLRNARPIPKNKIKLDIDRGKKIRLEASIRPISDSFHQSYDVLRNGEATLEDRRAVVTRLQGMITQLEGELRQYSNSSNTASTTPAATSQQISALEEEVSAATGAIARYENDIRRYEVDLALVTAERNRLRDDPGQEILKEKHDYDEHAIYGTVQRGVIHEDNYSINLHDIPMSRVHCEGQKSTCDQGGAEGRFTKEALDNAQQTLFQTVYYTPANVYGWSQVSVYYQSKDTPAYKTQINSKETQIAQINQRIADAGASKAREEGNLAINRQALANLRAQRGRVNQDELRQRTTELLIQRRTDLRTAEAQLAELAPIRQRAETALISDEECRKYIALIQLSRYFSGSELLNQFIIKVREYCASSFAVNPVLRAAIASLTAQPTAAVPPVRASSTQTISTSATAPVASRAPASVSTLPAPPNVGLFGGRPSLVSNSSAAVTGARPPR